MTHKATMWWTFAITSVALFMVTLDNLVVTTALPVIRTDLHSGLSGLEWTVNAYTLTFAVLLLTGAALGDRFGRRRLLHDRDHDLHARLGRGGARAVDRCARRGARGPGARRRDRDAADADDPLGGGADRAARARARRVGRDQRPRRRDRAARRRRRRLRHLVALDLLAERADRHRARAARAARACARSHGPTTRFDLPGVALASAGLFGIVWGLVRGNSVGWGSAGDRRRARRGLRGARRVRLVGAPHGRARCCRCASSATARSRSRTSRASSCSSGCSARSSCSRSSSRPCRATRRCRRACGSCRGRRCRSSSRRSPARSPTGSAGTS